MRKLLVLLSMFVLLVALMPVAPAAASFPTNVSGMMHYTPYLTNPDEAPKTTPGGNTFFDTYEDSWWEGSFKGTSYDECVVIIHRSGRWTYRATGYFEGSVNGKKGKLTMRLTGSRPDGESDWSGHWVILSGSGGLKNLRGQGTFEGPGSPGFGEEGDISYKGKVHFVPAH